MKIVKSIIVLLLIQNCSNDSRLSTQNQSKKPRANISRLFFSLELLDTQFYKCACFESNEEKIMSVYISDSTFLIKGQRMHAFLLNNLYNKERTSSHDSSVFDYIYSKNDTVYYYPISYYQLIKEKTKIKIDDIKPSVLFIINSNENSVEKWVSKTPFWLGDTINIEKKEDNTITYVSSLPGKDIPSHASGVTKLKLNLDSGIVSFFYYDGYSEWKCLNISSEEYHPSDR